MPQYQDLRKLPPGVRESGVWIMTSSSWIPNGIMEMMLCDEVDQVIEYYWLSKTDKNNLVEYLKVPIEQVDLTLHKEWTFKWRVKKTESQAQEHIDIVQRYFEEIWQWIYGWYRQAKANFLLTNPQYGNNDEWEHNGGETTPRTEPISIELQETTTDIGGSDNWVGDVDEQSWAPTRQQQDKKPAKRKWRPKGKKRGKRS